MVQYIELSLSLSLPPIFSTHLVQMDGGIVMIIVGPLKGWIKYFSTELFPINWLCLIKRKTNNIVFQITYNFYLAQHYVLHYEKKKKNIIMYC